MRLIVSTHLNLENGIIDTQLVKMGLSGMDWPSTCRGLVFTEALLSIKNEAMGDCWAWVYTCNIVVLNAYVYILCQLVPLVFFHFILSLSFPCG